MAVQAPTAGIALPEERIPTPDITLLAEEPEQTPRGTKRKLDTTTPRADSPALHEILTPVSGSRSSTPHPGASEQALDVFEDGHSEYEWIRLPKKRSYDLFKVARQDPSQRDSAELPLVARRAVDGREVTLWAKMDTGADCNVINRSTVRALFGAATERHLRALTLADQGDFSLVGNNRFRATHYAVLAFRAGRSRRSFEAVRFIVIPDDWQDPNGDGVPNVILGYPFLRENSMMMIDLDFHQEADPALEVVAERAESEKQGSRAILLKVYAATKGVSRPGGVKRPR